MSPKINKSGVSYDERDPRSAVPSQRDGDDEGPRVVRAQDFDAAQEGLRRDDEMNDSSVNADPDDFVGDDLEGVEKAEPQDSYDDKIAWPYMALQAECKNRELDGSVSVAREDLVARLREDDEKKRSDGNDTLSGVND